MYIYKYGDFAMLLYGDFTNDNFGMHNQTRRWMSK